MTRREAADDFIRAMEGRTFTQEPTPPTRDRTWGGEGDELRRRQNQARMAGLPIPKTLDDEWR